MLASECNDSVGSRPTMIVPKASADHSRHYYSDNSTIIQHLFLKSEGKGGPETPSAYGSLCMLDTAAPRVAAETETRRNDRGKGSFRAGGSTIGEVAKLSDAFVAPQNRQEHPRLVVLITLDVRNAFGPAR
ncbi:hypothetical protein J6590_020040 [Homalodisca vitripennis]|nr:hypothetical protein J6590_020040 [Homalodisca vitripennis]